MLGRFIAAVTCCAAFAFATVGAQAQPALGHLCEPGASLNLDNYVGFYRAVLHPGFVVDEDGVVSMSQQQFMFPVSLMRYGPDELVMTAPGTDFAMSLFDSDGTAWAYAEGFDADGNWPALLTVGEVTTMTGCEPIDLAHMLAGDVSWHDGNMRLELSLRVLPGQSGALYGHGFGFGYPDGSSKVYRGIYYVELVPWQ